MSVEIPEDLQIAVKSRAPLRGLTFRLAVVQALDQWLESQTKENVGINTKAEAGDSDKVAVDRIYGLIKELYVQLGKVLQTIDSEVPEREIADRADAASRLAGEAVGELERTDPGTGSTETTGGKRSRRRAG